MSEHLIQVSAHQKWKVFTEKPPVNPEPKPLFPGLSTPSKVDEKFQRWGWLRGHVETRKLSRPPRPDRPATLLLNLRVLFGRQARAEVFAWLLSHDAGHPAQIAKETEYFRGSIQNVLNELELSGQVQATRLGREKLFSLRPESWRFLLPAWQETGAEFPVWRPWAGIFMLTWAVHRLIKSEAFAKGSADFQVIELNRVALPLVDRLTAEGLAAQMAALREGTGVRPTVASELAGVLTALEK